MAKATSPFVTTDWLEARLNEKTVKVIDGSWYLPQMGRDADAEFLSHHIQGAVRFHPDAIADTSSDLPHMAASPSVFSDMVGALGISHEDDIVVYDGMGLISAARVWWNFMIMGARNVRVLAGGMPKWLDEKRPVESGAAKPDAVQFLAQPVDLGAVSAAEIMSLLETPATEPTQIVDVRSAGRFNGEEPEPRPGLRSGHIPGSFNLPFTDLIVDGMMLDEPSLRAMLTRIGIDTTKPIISTCGSGITAPIFNLALATLGVESMQVYDGSWTEWGGDSSLPVDGANE